LFGRRTGPQGELKTKKNGAGDFEEGKAANTIKRQKTAGDVWTSVNFQVELAALLSFND